MGGRHGGRSRAARREDGLAAVRERLQGYADRGVFRGFSEEPTRGGRHRFKFLWLNTTFVLSYVPVTGALFFRELLPNVSARSSVGIALRSFVKSRAGLNVPDHRRIDPRRAAVQGYVRSGAFSVVITAKKNYHGYGVHRAVNLIQEIFVQLHTYFPEYMVENFDAPQE